MARHATEVLLITSTELQGLKPKGGVLLIRPGLMPRGLFSVLFYSILWLAASGYGYGYGYGHLFSPTDGVLCEGKNRHLSVASGARFPGKIQNLNRTHLARLLLPQTLQTVALWQLPRPNLSNSTCVKKQCHSQLTCKVTVGRFQALCPPHTTQLVLCEPTMQRMT